MLEVRAYVPPIPFPQQLKSHYQRLLDRLQKLHMDILANETIANMPSYAEFLKEIIRKKKKLEAFPRVSLTKEPSAVPHNRLPVKMKDPWSFIVPCYFEKILVEKCLCDLGSSVNLMPLSFFKKLKFAQLIHTTVTLQLADRSI